MESLKLIKEAMGERAEDLPRFVHFSWCIKELGKSYKIKSDELDDLYTGLVSGVIGNLGSGKDPEFVKELSSLQENDRFSNESYLKLFYCMVEYGRYLHPFDEWIKTNPESDTWVDYVTEASEIESIYEKDPEKWLAEFRIEISK